MTPIDDGHFTDMDGNPIEDAPEPAPCPFCGSGADQLVVERWSEEEDPDASYHVECLKCGPTARRAQRSSRQPKDGTGESDRLKSVHGALDNQTEVFRRDA